MLNLLTIFNFLPITMAINADSWKETLPVMLFGMIGIFIVIGVIVGIIYIINKASSSVKTKKDNKKNDNK